MRSCGRLGKDTRIERAPFFRAVQQISGRIKHSGTRKYRDDLLLLLERATLSHERGINYAGRRAQLARRVNGLKDSCSDMLQRCGLIWSHDAPPTHTTSSTPAARNAPDGSK